MKVKTVKKKDCDKLMQELIHRQNELGNIGYPKHIDFLNHIQGDPVLWSALNFLHAKEYVSITLDINKVLNNVQIEDAGITYFEDYFGNRSEKTHRVHSLLDHNGDCSCRFHQILFLLLLVCK